MAAHLTEEEQIAALKRWWESNGKLVVVAILVAVVGWFGWSTWQDRQARMAQEASRQYTELMTAVDAAQGEMSEEQRSTAKLIAAEISEGYSDTLYGDLATLTLAKLAVNAGELDEAESQLRSLADSAANESMGNLARLRLARVLTAKGDTEQALEILNTGVDQAYQAAYSEARGDIYLAQEQFALAQTAYEEALASLGPQSGRSGILQLKLNNTRVAGNETASEETAAPATEGDA